VGPHGADLGARDEPSGNRCSFCRRARCRPSEGRATRPQADDGRRTSRWRPRGSTRPRLPGSDPFMISTRCTTRWSSRCPATPWPRAWPSPWSLSKDGLTYEFVLRQGPGSTTAIRHGRGREVLVRAVSRRRVQAPAGASAVWRSWTRTGFASSSKSVARLHDLLRELTTGAGWVVPRNTSRRWATTGFKKAPIGAGRIARAPARFGLTSRAHGPAPIGAFLKPSSPTFSRYFLGTTQPGPW